MREIAIKEAVSLPLAQRLLKAGEDLRKKALSKGFDLQQRLPEKNRDRDDTARVKLERHEKGRLYYTVWRRTGRSEKVA
jgi:hypothetical protein